MFQRDSGNDPVGQIMIMKRDGFQVSARKLRSGIDLQQPEYPHYGGRYRADDGHIE